LVHNTTQKDKLTHEDFYTGLARGEETQYNVRGVLEQDLKFALSMKALSQETFDLLTV
jgi:hypothetical protein